MVIDASLDNQNVYWQYMFIVQAISLSFMANRQNIQKPMICVSENVWQTINALYLSNYLSTHHIQMISTIKFSSKHLYVYDNYDQVYFSI